MPQKRINYCFSEYPPVDLAIFGGMGEELQIK
jgi:hypothetical protein